MTMLKGYTIPSPGANDGEYGAFGNCAGCESKAMSHFAASPAEVPYWAGQGIGRTIPALNGFGLATEAQVDALQAQAEGMTGEPLDLKMLAGAAFLGWFFGGNRGAVIGAGVGVVFGKKIRSIATGVSSLVTGAADPSVAGFGMSPDDFYRDSAGRRQYIRKHSQATATHGFGNTLTAPPPGEKCPPDSGTWCSDFMSSNPPTGSTIPSVKQVTTVVDLISGAHPATTIGPTSTGPGPNVVPFQPPAPGNFVQQEAPLDVTMIGGAAAVGFFFKGTTGALIGAAIAAYVGRGRSDVNLVPAPTGQPIVGGLLAP